MNKLKGSREVTENNLDPLLQRMAELEKEISAAYTASDDTGTRTALYDARTALYKARAVLQTSAAVQEMSDVIGQSYVAEMSISSSHVGIAWSTLQRLGDTPYGVIFPQAVKVEAAGLKSSDNFNPGLLGNKVEIMFRKGRPFAVSGMPIEDMFKGPKIEGSLTSAANAFLATRI